MLHRSKRFSIILVIVVRLFNYTTFSKNHIPGFSCSFPHLYIHGFVLQPLFWYFSFPFSSNIFFFSTPYISPLFCSFFFRHFFFMNFFFSFTYGFFFVFCFCFFPGCIGFKMGDLDRWVLSFLTCLECWGKWGGLVRFHHDEVLEFFFCCSFICDQVYTNVLL